MLLLLLLLLLLLVTRSRVLPARSGYCQHAIALLCCTASAAVVSVLILYDLVLLLHGIQSTGPLP